MKPRRKPVSSRRGRGGPAGCRDGRRWPRCTCPPARATSPTDQVPLDRRENVSPTGRRQGQRLAGMTDDVVRCGERQAGVAQQLAVGRLGDGRDEEAGRDPPAPPRRRRTSTGRGRSHRRQPAPPRRAGPITSGASIRMWTITVRQRIGRRWPTDRCHGVIVGKVRRRPRWTRIGRRLKSYTGRPGGDRSAVGPDLPAVGGAVAPVTRDAPGRPVDGRWRRVTASRGRREAGGGTVGRRCPRSPCAGRSRSGGRRRPRSTCWVSGHVESAWG